MNITIRNTVYTVKNEAELLQLLRDMKLIPRKTTKKAS